MSPSRQFLLHLCLTIIGVMAFPTESDGRNQTADNSTGLWDPKTSSFATIIPTEQPSQPSVRQLPEITRSRKTTPDKILYVTGGIGEDYDYYDDDEDDSVEEATFAPPRVSVIPCPYNRCKHLELPCEEIQMRAGGNCLCPGLSGRSIKPDSPRLLQVIPGDQGASVNWCSPLSTVQGYRVVYKTSDGPMEIGPILNSTYRFYSINNLLPDMSYRVCVVAFNEAGESPVGESEEEEQERLKYGTMGPCMVFHTSGKWESKIYLGIGVGLALLAGVLGLIVFVFWLWKKKRVSSRKLTDSGERGITNMSFKADSVEQL
ncbi:LRRN4 C-terminal-like protein [Pelobates fuscus]|uniref:LRRN4 C-terminal-like protein n=1 Tax=Pelobates fuscus TaxID=191477 RepID=UPI002FE49059